MASSAGTALKANRTIKIARRSRRGSPHFPAHLADQSRAGVLFVHQRRCEPGADRGGLWRFLDRSSPKMFWRSKFIMVRSTKRITLTAVSSDQGKPTYDGKPNR